MRNKLVFVAIIALMFALAAGCASYTATPHDIDYTGEAVDVQPPAPEPEPLEPKLRQAFNGIAFLVSVTPL